MFEKQSGLREYLKSPAEYDSVTAKIASSKKLLVVLGPIYMNWLNGGGMGLADLEKSCKLSSSGKFRDLESPHNSVTRDKQLPEICVLISFCGMMKSSNLDCPSSIHSPSSSILCS